MSSRRSRSTGRVAARAASADGRHIGSASIVWLPINLRLALGIRPVRALGKGGLFFLVGFLQTPSGNEIRVAHIIPAIEDAYADWRAIVAIMVGMN